jgi:hypothetical protein
MPASDVTVMATFLKTDVHCRWERAKALIENHRFRFEAFKMADGSLNFKYIGLDVVVRSQLATNSDDWATTQGRPYNWATTQGSPDNEPDLRAATDYTNEILRLRFALADAINLLIAETNFTISYGDVVVFDFNYRSPISGDADNPSGTDGFFEFRVSPAIVNNSAYSEGVITATAFDPTNNDIVGVRHALPLRAWTNNGTLHVSGLTPGQPWSVYSISGTLVYRNIAVDANVNIPLPERGLYIIQSGNRTIKLIMN